MTDSTEGTIAIIEDDQDIAANIEAALKEYRFVTRAFSTASEFERALENFRPDLCLIDLGLPDQNGLDLVKTLSDKPGIAIIIISGRRGTSDKIVGLEMGADDYISKPFETPELIARVRTVLRRFQRSKSVNGASGASKESHTRARFGEWSVDLENFSLTHSSGSVTQLSKAEMDIMKMFIHGPNRIFTRNQILDVLELDPAQNYDRSIDVRISRIRAKLKEDPQLPKLIKTVYGAGYMFVARVEWGN